MKPSNALIVQVLSALFAGAMAVFCAKPGIAATPNGDWRASLQTPGGSLPFDLTLTDHAGTWTAAIKNGPETIEITKVTVDKSQIVIRFDYYDARIEATYNASSDTMDGTFKKRRAIDKVATMPFRADRPQPANRQRRDADPFLGRWKVKFSNSKDPAIGVMQRDPNGILWGTVMTTTGDYRYLAGALVEGTIELSCFDGSHAFLFRAVPNDDGTLQGDFWSGNWWHETWTAERNEDFQLPNAFELTTWNENILLDQLEFPDLDGHVVPIMSADFIGKPLVIELFGSWCPNCHDAGKYISDTADRYRNTDLRVIGLAFELTGDIKRDAKQVRRYKERFNLDFPIYICGLADKTAATAQFPALDQIRAYPTIIFADRNHKVRFVYTGFNGPATGERHLKMKEKFETIIDNLLN